MKIFLKNFFNYRLFLSRSAWLLFLIGFFLSLVSFFKGIQLLMFIPAFVLSIFLISLFEIFFIKINIVLENGKNGNILKLFIPKNKKYNFILATKSKEGYIEFLHPNNEKYYQLDIFKDYDLFLYIFGSFDIFRKKIHIGKYNYNLEKENDSYISIKKYIDGDVLDKIDAKKTSLANYPYLKVEDNFSLQNKQTVNLFLESNLDLEVKGFKNLDLVHFILILFGALGFLIEWQDIFFYIYLFFSFIFVFILKRKRVILGEKKQKVVMLIAFFIMLFLTIIYSDMSGSGSIFLIQLLLISFLTPKGSRNSFLYMFLMLFVFVSISLFSSQIRFIFLFLGYLLISTYLLFFISGDETYEKNKYKIGPKFSLSLLLKTFFTVIFLIISLYFLLPHGPSNKTQSGLNPSNSSTTSGFNEEVSLENVGSISLDNSKIFVIEDISKSLISQLGLKYFRGARLNYFDGTKWTSDFKADLKQFTNTKNVLKKITLKFNYYQKTGKNIFIPKTVLNIENEDYFSYFNVGNDNTILKTNNDITNNLSLNLTFKQLNDGKIEDYISKINDFKLVESQQTKKIFEKYFESIPQNITNSAEELTDYVKNKSGFTYNRTKPAKDLNDFLYGSKAGHCEYFATVLAITLQHFGYKATLVNGYVGDDYNEMANSLIIRGKNAHSWVEVFQKNNWIIYDATPSLYLDFSDNKTFGDYIKPITKFYDYIDIKFYIYIVNYTKNEQKEFYKFLLKNVLNIVFFIFFIVFIKYFYNFFKLIISFFILNNKEKLAFVFCLILNKKVFALNELKLIDEKLFYKYQGFFYGNKLLSKREVYLDILKIIKLKYFKKH